MSQTSFKKVNICLNIVKILWSVKARKKAYIAWCACILLFRNGSLVWRRVQRLWKWWVITCNCYYMKMFKICNNYLIFFKYKLFNFLRRFLRKTCHGCTSSVWWCRGVNAGFLLLSGLRVYGKDFRQIQKNKVG